LLVLSNQWLTSYSNASLSKKKGKSNSSTKWRCDIDNWMVNEWLTMHRYNFFSLHNNIDELLMNPLKYPRYMMFTLLLFHLVVLFIAHRAIHYIEKQKRTRKESTLISQRWSVWVCVFMDVVIWNMYTHRLSNLHTHLPSRWFL
jgi:hypothetical protein